MKTRVLVLTAAYPGPTEPYRAIFLEHLHRELASAGDFECTVVAPRVHERDPLVEQRAGVQVRRFGYPSGGKRLKEHDRTPWLALVVYLISALWCVLRTARRDEYRVLVCHWVLPSALVGWFARLVLGVPLVVYAHGTDVRRFVGKSGLATWLVRRATRRARIVFAVSEELARTMRRHLAIPERRLRVLPMGVASGFACGDRAASRRELDLDETRTHALFVGDLSVDKGVRELAGAAALVEKQGLSATFHVVGSGPLESELAGCPTIDLVGPLPPEDLAKWYRAADLLVFPSHTEGAPLVVMEALSSGLPVVSTRVGGIPELVEEGKTGYLVEPGHTHTVAEAAVRLISNHETRLAMRSRIESRIERAEIDHSVARRAREFRSAVEEALASERR